MCGLGDHLKSIGAGLVIEYTNRQEEPFIAITCADRSDPRKAECGGRTGTRS